MDECEEALREALERQVESGCVEMAAPGQLRLRPKGFIAATIIHARACGADAAELAEELLDRLAEQGIPLEPRALVASELRRRSCAPALRLIQKSLQTTCKRRLFRPP